MKKPKSNYSCIACGKIPLSKNEIGINRKLLGEMINGYYCLPCFANYFEVSEQDILDKIEEFREEGCKLFE
ncbi:MAG: hypothetical protein K2N87_01215 [Eubacterium sp.]|nr:hypothetical protein [Eubacterium sp.]